MRKSKPQKEAAALIKRGAAHRKGGELENEEQCYQEALRLVPEFVTAHANLGELYCHRASLSSSAGALDLSDDAVGQFERGMEAFRRAASLDPTDFSLHANLFGAKCEFVHDSEPARQITEFEQELTWGHGGRPGRWINPVE